MQQFDFAFYKGTDIDYQLTSQIETTRIELKHEPLLLPGEAVPIESQTLTAAKTSKATISKSRINTLLYYAGHIIAVYDALSIADIYQVNGPLVERLELGKFFAPTNLQIQQISFVLMTRLDWQDREFDTMQRS